MKMNLVACDGAVLRPCMDEDYEQRMKLRKGQVYECTLTLVRNYRFHRKFFALLNAAWECQDEASRAFFGDSVDCFRKTLTVAAGFFDRVWSVERAEWIEIPKSIRFDAMDEAEFSDLYDRVLDIICQHFLGNATKEELEHIIANF